MVVGVGRRWAVALGGCDGGDRGRGGQGGQSKAGEGEVRGVRG